MGSNEMSALGQKQTFAVQNAMSALTPKADMCSALAHVRYIPGLGARSRYVTICLMVLRTGRRMLHRLAIIAMTLLSGLAGGQVAAQ